MHKRESESQRRLEGGGFLARILVRAWAGKNGGYGGEVALSYMRERGMIWRSRETFHFYFF